METQRAISVVADGLDIAVNDQQAISDPTRLRNPLGTPMWVDSICVIPQYITTGPTTPVRELGDLLIRLWLGREPLTNGFVPVCTLDRIPNTSRAASSGGVTVITSVGSYSYVWRFKKPLFVPMGGYIVPEFWNTGLTANANYDDIVFAYRGRSLPIGFTPDEVHIPWNAAFMGRATSLTSNPANQVLQSKKSDLVNPFDVPMKICRMTGLINFKGQPSFTVTSTIQLLDERHAFIRVTDSKGGIIIRDPTPFGHAFQVLDAAWQMNAVIDAKQHYIAMLNMNYGDLGSITDTGTPIAQPYVAISGYRSLPFARAQLA